MSVAYLFPGQGSQSAEMGRVLYEQHPEARAIFDQADSVLGFKLSELCIDGSDEDLADTSVQQPAVFVTSLARWAVIEAQNWPRADYVAGHSLGELTALTAAGCFSFVAGLQLAHERGQLMTKWSRPGAMAAILGLDVGTVNALCKQVSAETGRIVTLANDNSPRQQVISGEADAVEKVGRAAVARGARKAVSLPISIASHCDLMTDVSAEFGKVLATAPINIPRLPVISNLTTGILFTVDQIRHELAMQVTQCVRWRESMLTLRDLGVETLIDVGPNDVLHKLMRRIDKTATRFAFDPETPEPPLAAS